MNARQGAESGASLRAVGISGGEVIQAAPRILPASKINQNQWSYYVSLQHGITKCLELLTLLINFFIRF